MIANFRKFFQTKPSKETPVQLTNSYKWFDQIFDLLEDLNIEYQIDRTITGWNKEILFSLVMKNEVKSWDLGGGDNSNIFLEVNASFDSEEGINVPNVKLYHSISIFNKNWISLITPTDDTTPLRLNDISGQLERLERCSSVYRILKRAKSLDDNIQINIYCDNDSYDIITITFE